MQWCDAKQAFHAQKLSSMDKIKQSCDEEQAKIQPLQLTVNGVA